jgi:ankyrin repeat protein
VSADRELWELCQARDAPADRARELLEGGANPNAVFDNDFGPVSALFGAAGVRHDAALTRLLLAQGADPNGEPTFGDALYHSVESPDSACTRALLEAGAEPNGSHALAHALDYERPEHVDLLLAAGARPNGGDLGHAIRRGRDLATIRLLVDHGADVHGRGGEWSTPEDQYRTAYQQAVLRNRRDLVELLAELGANTTVSDDDRAVAAVARGERAALPDPLDPDPQEVLAESVLHDGNLELVVELLGVDRVLHNGGGPAGTLLHMAAWMGRADLVEQLLARGADADTRLESGTPLDWSAHGARGEVARVTELLTAAGGTRS